MTTRHPSLQRFLDGMAARISEPTAKLLMEGSDHPYPCRCAVCLAWWAAMGPETNGKTPTWGPFTAKEIREYKEEKRVHDDQ